MMGAWARCSGGHVDVAAAHGQSVGLADGGSGDDFDGQVEVGDHAGDDENLLVVFGAEDGEVWLDAVEQLAADGGDAAEVDRATDAAQGCGDAGGR